ncbi:EAL and HDOD domain-containing protein [Vibrio genomosp. F10]|uniref:Histidine kinase n=2 Tax=Vibrio genomosp. F10 TaxID=723171 RepID=A0A1B9R264_9VIBR|nr:EAL domain-containing protein [Vibrio genomosp. F10]OCH78281.1 histidine kinase [Vibrio genomosp. F10]OEE36266.1 histidine kinase [Vibrio genomosp. F10 str. ZF-129]OEE98550.1 histidine kinase [Vibrio genomosp. F10 str. 9ZC157]OEF06062.1 histidine kinase [Vibrio genomosp. F10 str. 9ZD137]
MKDIYVARQPILNAKRQTLGYELLFRDGENNAFPAHIESNRATYRLIVENFLAIGTNPSIESSRCFINFPYQSLIRRLPLMLPKDKVVIEVLETCQPTEELLTAIKELHQQGYLIALDDFVYHNEWRSFLPYVQIVKIDIMAVGMANACIMLKNLKARNSRLRFLAERVETREEFMTTRSAGFTLFQGYFFSKPELVKQRYISPDQVVAMQLFQEVCKQDVDFDKVERIIAQDAQLSYKLLKFVNSMSDRLSVPISSFRQALLYLGQDKLKSFVSLTVASFISRNKPQELSKLSLQRAQFCLLMSPNPIFSTHRDQAFLIGLFSLLDALLDLSLGDLMEQLPLSDSIKSILLERSGPFGSLLQLEECFERADWQGLQSFCNALDLNLQEVVSALSSAQKWSQQVNQIA